MSTWTTPVTWTNGAVSAATMNTEVRDHLNFLKGSLDLISNSTTADTGTAMFLRVVRGSATDQGLDVQITGDTQPRIRIAADRIAFGAGGASATDMTLQRESNVRMKVVGPAFVVERSSENAVFMGRYTGDANDRWYVTNSGQMRWGPGTTAVDTGLDRVQAGFLRLPDSPDTGLIKHGAAVGSTFLRGALSSDSNYRVLVQTDGTIFWADGTSATDVNMQRNGGQRLLVTGLLQTTEGVGIKTNGGAVSDASFPAGLTKISGMIALDTTNSRLYARVGSTWKSVVLA